MANAFAFAERGLTGRCNHLDFDMRAARQRRNPNGRARGVRRLEEGLIDLVHCDEVVHIREIDVRLDDVREAQASGAQDGGDTLEELLGLRTRAALDELVRRGIDAELARQKKRVPAQTARE